MKKFLLSVLLTTGLTIITNAQVQVQPCHTHEMFEENCAKNPKYREAVDRAMEKAVKKGAKTLSKTGAGGDTVFRIPVVFHIIYRTNQENLHDSLIHNQLKVLNENFNRLNSDTSKTRAIFKPV